MTEPNIQNHCIPQAAEPRREPGDETGKRPPAARASPVPPFGTEPRREDVLKALRGRL